MSKIAGPAFSYSSSSVTPVGSPNVSSTAISPSYTPLPQSSLTSHAGPSHWRPPAHWRIDETSTNGSIPKKPPRKKIRTTEEEEITAATATRVSSRLATDHTLVRFPDVDAPFTDKFDVINRLLPYHVFLQPQEDLMNSDRKGKTKAFSEDKQEIQETKFALECARRRRKLTERFRKARVRSGQEPSPNDQIVVLTQSVLDADRSDLALLNSELRSARTELEKLEREKRAASNPQRPYYTQSSVQAPYYRGYPAYTYAQAYGVPQQQSTTATSTPTTNQNPTPYQSGAAIPVQLPVASLPALNQLGITPVPAASVPTDGQPPPAVLRGSSANGTMLNLEINVSLLHSAQMSGLALILNSLMSRTAGTASNSAPSAPSNSG
ncbi:hypothetical protein K435DRAFT_966306 [Dendrothele bispora CBS 962.96]|uniref:GLTSCR protein conserved domain-containing protein n=1 Tax=Dendrothele bispora (strain CBS 962.96) TaxID=1314807 RepID=A0A4V4HFN6_DENBC|nr:hypothetical protein K435DRAFT_966306 [Dendrothele bispora CBS 962.96]